MQYIPVLKKESFLEALMPYFDCSDGKTVTLSISLGSIVYGVVVSLPRTHSSTQRKFEYKE